MHFVLEALIVGAATAVLGFVISTLMMFAASPKFSLKKYSFWPAVVASFFVTGFLIHVGSELFGVNKAYCKYGYACNRRDNGRLGLD